MKKALIGILAVAMASSAAWANLANGDFENCTLTTQATWTAGTDQVGQWYAGPDMAIVGSAGSKYLANQETGTDPSFAAVRDVVQAMPIPAAGTYTFNMSFQFGSDYTDQIVAANVLLVQSGAQVPLTGGVYWDGPQGGTWTGNIADVLDVDPGNGTGVGTFDGNWHNLSDTQPLTFTITPDQAGQYNYLLVYSASSRKNDPDGDQTALANTDNYFTSASAPVPEPITMATVFMALGGLGTWVRRRMARPHG